MVEATPPVTIKLDHMPDDYTHERYRIAYVPTEVYERGEHAMHGWLVDRMLADLIDELAGPESPAKARPPRYRQRSIPNTNRGSVMAANKKASKKKKSAYDERGVYNPDRVKILMTPAKLLPGAEKAVREFFIEQVAQEIYRRQLEKQQAEKEKNKEQQPPSE